jgi:prophage regulatory protein
MRLLRRAEVQRKVGLSKSVIYDKIRCGIFPQPVPVTAKAVGWIESEIDQWIADRIAARDAEKKAGTF